MSEDRDKLKQLLLSEEIAQIEALRKLLEDQQKFSEKVSDVLDHATNLTIKNNPNFRKKFSKIDSRAFSKAIKANKQTFIDALLPIIGPMIRQSVTNAIRRFVSDVNRTLEMGFSLKALKWRWQAMTTGVPFGELVFNNTIEYQVQQVFLIDNETGLLIEYAGQEDALLQDKEAMSAMLTAIQDFVKDSINSQSEGLSAAELGEQLLWLIKGSHANLAVVVKGAPTSRLREKLTDACEEIHAEFSADLKNQLLWNNNPDLKAQLELLLLTKTQSDDQGTKSSINFWPWIIILLGITGWYAWNKFQNNKSHNALLAQLQQTPGFVLQQLSHQDGNYMATGLQDPHADLSHLPQNLLIQATPFISLDDTMVASRVGQFLEDGGIEVQVEHGVAFLTGSTPLTPELQQKINQLRLLPGVNEVNLQFPSAQTLQQKFSEFIEQNPPPANISLGLEQETVIARGQALASAAQPYLAKVNSSFEHVNQDQLTVTTYDETLSEINHTHVSIIDPAQIDLDQQQMILNVISNFSLLANENPAIRLKLIPMSDCQGTIEKSNNNIRSRDKLIKQFMLTAGFPADKLISEAIFCEVVSDVIDYNLLGVGFEVVE